MSNAFPLRSDGIQNCAASEANVVERIASQVEFEKDGMQHSEFQADWKLKAAEFESYLAQELHRRTHHDGVRGPSPLVDAIEYSLLSPGKRLRPLLALWASELGGEDYRVALPAAVAVEMIHCYSLIHDDLPAMDDDDLRRGRATCHIAFDEATAILAGDALQPMAFAVLAGSFSPKEHVVEACQLLAEAAGPMALVGGQAEDLLAERETIRYSNDRQMLSRIHIRKTGAMIRVSLELGALAGNCDEKQRKAVSCYGTAIGQAFQIVDDLLDVQSTSDKLGKRTGKDAAAGKLTYPGMYGIEASRKAAEQYTEDAIRTLKIFGSRASPLIELARTILERTH